VHAGTGSGSRNKLVADRILDAEGDEIETFQWAVLGADLYLDRVPDRKPLRPGQVIGCLIDILFAPVMAVKGAPQDPTGNPAFEVHSIAEVKGAAEPDSALRGSNCLCSQLLQLGGKDSFQP